MAWWCTEHPIAQTDELVVDIDQKNVKRVMERRVCSEQSPFSGTWKWLMCYGRNQLGDATFDLDPRYQRALPPQTPEPARQLLDQKMIEKCLTYRSERDCENGLLPETRFCMWGVLDSKLQCLVRCASILNKDVCLVQKRCTWKRDTFSGKEMCQAQPAFSNVDTDPVACRGGKAPTTYYSIQQYKYFFYGDRCYPSQLAPPSYVPLPVQLCPIATLPYLIFGNKCWGWAPHDPSVQCPDNSPYAWDENNKECLAYPPVKEELCVPPYVPVQGKCLFDNKMLNGANKVNLCLNQGYLSEVQKGSHVCEKPCMMLTTSECPSAVASNGRARCKLDTFFNDNRICVPA
jgi:hypothetical protein